MAQLQRVRSGFNRITPVYDLMAALFSLNYIQRSQTALLPLPRQYQNALVLGGGTGKFLMELIKRNTAQHYCYIDLSDKMIEATKKRLATNKFSTPVQLICGSYTEIPATEKFDLIITNYVLDCFTEAELPQVLNTLHEHLNPNGNWLFVDFNIPQRLGFKLFSKIVTRLLYLFFNALCGLSVKQLPDFNAAFRRLGYTIEKERYFFGGLLVARVYKK